MRLLFETPSSPNASVAVDDPLLVVAGFTGRDRDVVEEHIAELGHLGISPPERLPALYVLPNWLLRLDASAVQVAGAETSGEAEPVLVRLADGELFVTVGSDHTHRALERISYGASKLACPKTVCSSLWRVDEIAHQWDELLLKSYTGVELASYQEASLAALLSPTDLLAIVEDRVGLERPLILFMGTVPLRSEIRYADRFTARLSRGHDVLESAYDIEVVDALDGSLDGLTSASPSMAKRAHAESGPTR